MRGSESEAYVDDRDAEDANAKEVERGSKSELLLEGEVERGSKSELLLEGEVCESDDRRDEEEGNDVADEGIGEVDRTGANVLEESKASN